MGNTFYQAQQDSIVVIIGTNYYGEEQASPNRITICKSKPHEDLETYLHEDAGKKIDLQPVYLRNIAEWW